MWDLPGPGLEPVPPALAGGFLTTVPPGKSSIFFSNAKIKRMKISSTGNQTVTFLTGYQQGFKLDRAREHRK